MSWLLGKKAAPSKGNAPSVSSSMEALGLQVEKLEKKVEHLEKKAQMELKEAKKVGTKTPTTKKKALQHMKRYKTYQTQIEQFSGQRDNMEAQKSALEMASLVAGNVDAMRAGAQAMKKIIDPDEVEDVVADVVDITDRIKDTVDIISQPMGLTEDHDEDELEQELEDFLLEDEEELEDLPDIDDANLVPDLPNPGVKKVNAVDKDTDDLEAWMAN